FFDNKIVTLKSDDPNPTIFIFVYIDNICFQHVTIDGGANINIISSHAYNQMCIPTHYMHNNLVMLHSINDAITLTLGTIIIHICVGSGTVPKLFYILEGEFHYNLLLGQPWILVISYVPSTLHHY
ncbi:hypothetical protein KI387_020599, partial [Taxus chinensis]